MRRMVACSRKTYDAPANAMSSAASVAVCQSASRARTESSTVGTSGLREHVARAAARVDERRRTVRVQLAPQTIDIHLECVRPRIMILVPHVCADLGAAQDAAGVARQKLEQRILLGRQQERTIPPSCGLAARVHHEISNREHTRQQLTPAAQERPQPCEQLAEGEG